MGAAIDNVLLGIVQCMHHKQVSHEQWKAYLPDANVVMILCTEQAAVRALGVQTCLLALLSEALLS